MKPTYEEPYIAAKPKEVSMLSKEEYEYVCSNLKIPAYQDQEHEDKEWRLYSDGELLMDITLAIREIGESK